MHSIVCQVNKLIRDCRVIQLVDLGAQASIPFLEEENLQLVGNEDPHSQVELPIVNQEWILKIFLNDKGVCSDNRRKFRRGP